MASIYDEMRELADELLTADDDNFGQSETGNVISILTRSDVAGATALDEPTVTWTPAQVKAASRGVSAERDGASLAAKSEKVVIIAAEGVTMPTLEKKIAIGSLAYPIVHVEPVPNGNTPAVYKVYVKR